ncbi:hypothetical protein P153DRAFT_368077 [Dothidotthia symphoricarpi CBS 119687]|uniref:Uncharacterized protein n=1 Tax=Dothidotthia symphoricarpi CBS 119687 TaxID=1392245 RepID=A0A6A6A9H5_9PLEO|nr:uncharacterized protein P153DRAFT_368077 [Dothidotthia symphoricarpi CBS 119687]KAF2128206.1 hypothetical protein P153DRAFT_368077 [Dothidotthia symphoricarpi CBS 119687]
MFRDFSFDQASRSDYAHQAELDDDTAICPTSTLLEPENLPSRLPTPPPCLIGDLAHKFTQQSLRINTHIYPRHNAHASAPLTPPSDEGAFPTEPLGQADRPTYSRVSSSLLRMQRQANARMQCCPSRVRDISRLVRMIEAEEQCTVDEPASALTVDEADEGIDMDYDNSTRRADLVAGLSLRRSGERRDVGGARISKSARMRRRTRDDGLKISTRVT